MKKMLIVFILVMGMMGKGYGESDGGFTLATLSTAIAIPQIIITRLNVLEIRNERNYHIGVPIAGIILGGLMVADNWLNYKGNIYSNNNYFTNPIAFANIGIGSITFISSVWNLASSHKPKDTRTTWNLYSFPAHDKTMGMGMSFSLRF
ncbi:MAG: hypothetical protein WCL14_14430 [Bacteroidota bacterium]